MSEPLKHHFLRIAQAAIKERDDAMERTIGLFRDCGVEIERFHIIDHRPSGWIQLAIDGTVFCAWRINLNAGNGFDFWRRNK